MKNNRLYYKKFFRYTLALIAIFIFSLVTVNVYLDKYGIFKNDYSKQIYWPDERFVKTKHILNHPHKYDSFIFGDSRANTFNAKIITTGRFYNYSFPLSTIYETLRYLKLIIKNGTNVKTVILCLDNDSFKPNDYPYSPFGNIDQAYAYYPETSAQKIKFYSSYIFINPFVKGNDQFVFKDFNNLSMFDSGTTAQFMESGTFKNPHEEIKKVHTTSTPYNLINMRLLKKLVILCKQHDINLIVIILPEYYNSYKANKLRGYNYCKKILSEITPYYDFSGINKMTTDDYNFYNYRHFDYNVACAILDRIFKTDKYSAPQIEGFGDYVTKDNFNDHIKKLCSKTPEIKNCVPE